MKEDWKLFFEITCPCKKFMPFTQLSFIFCLFKNRNLPDTTNDTYKAWVVWDLGGNPKRDNKLW